MDTSLWAKLHGGTTHFPIALLIASVVFDLLALAIKREPERRDLQMTAFYALLLGALGMIAAVVSGLVLTDWRVWGSGLLAKHHLFVWPASALLVGLAAWRLRVREKASQKAMGAYLGVAVVASALMAGAGYWGGEMLLGGSAAPSPAASPAAPKGAKSGAQDASLVHGQSLYASECARCHGANGQGAIGPALQNTDLKDAQIAATIKNGVAGAMPAFGTRNTPAQIAAMTAFVRSLRQ